MEKLEIIVIRCILLFLIISGALFWAKGLEPYKTWLSKVDINDVMALSVLGSILLLSLSIEIIKKLQKPNQE